MIQRFSPPDRYLARCGHLDCVVTETAIQGAPPFMRGLRALFVSDVHATRRTADADFRALRQKMAGTQPDILLLGGDYSDRAEGTERFFEALRGFKAPLGIYGIIGNNDAEAWDGRLEALKRVMAEAGCEMLINGAFHLSVNGGTLDIAGVDEHLHGEPSAEGLYPARPAPDRYRILLSHYPRPATPEPDLTLSGHTHGGQFNLFGITPFNLGFERFKRRRRELSSLAVSGLHRVGGMQLLVSKGIGASRIQLRVGVQPEINLLVFR